MALGYSSANVDQYLTLYIPTGAVLYTDWGAEIISQGGNEAVLKVNAYGSSASIFIKFPNGTPDMVITNVTTGVPSIPTPTPTATPTPVPGKISISTMAIIFPSAYLQPKAGQTVPALITTNAQYSATISWSPALSSGKFIDGKIYTATITITP